MSEEGQYLSFSAQLVSLNMMTFSFIYVSTNDRISFFLMAEWYSTVYMVCTDYPVPPPANGALHLAVLPEVGVVLAKAVWRPPMLMLSQVTLVPHSHETSTAAETKL